MNRSKYALLVLVVFTLMVIIRATSLFAAPLGGHAIPPEAINYQCTEVTLAPGQSQTLTVPFTSNQYYLKLILEGTGAGQVNMQVFTSEQNRNGTGPVGLGTYNPAEPMHAKTWEGRFVAPDTIYVRLTNTNNFPVTVKLCSYERLWEPPPTRIPPTPVPPTPVPPTAIPTPPMDENKAKCLAQNGIWVCEWNDNGVVCWCDSYL